MTAEPHQNKLNFQHFICPSENKIPAQGSARLSSYFWQDFPELKEKSQPLLDILDILEEEDI